MNDIDAMTGGAATITWIHLVLIAVLALAAIAIIAWGMRLKRARVKAAREVAANAEEAGKAPGDVAPPTASAAPAPVPPVAVTQALRSDDAAPVPDRLADEPIAAAAFEANPAAEATAAAAPVPAAPADGPVTQLKGLGPKVATRLADLGIATVGQIAALDPDAAQALDAQLGAFAGRMERDRWIEQARFLAAGDIAGFEAVFGRL